MKFIPFLAFYLNHRQFVATTKITRRNTMHKYTRSIWETLLNKGRKPNQSFAIFFKRKTSTTIERLAHKRVLTNPRRLAPKRGVHFSQEGSTC
jgi:hypothetical protein